MQSNQKVDNSTTPVYHNFADFAVVFLFAKNLKKNIYLYLNKLETLQKQQFYFQSRQRMQKNCICYLRVTNATYIPTDNFKYHFWLFYVCKHRLYHSMYRKIFFYEKLQRKFTDSLD